MSRVITLLTVALVVATSPLGAQTTQPTTPELRAGNHFIPTPQHSAEDDAKALAAFAGLRVADVADGLDAAGLHDVGLVDPAIYPLWDGDGVVVVPRAAAPDVAAHAWKVIEGDKKARRNLYEKLGLPEDPSVK